MIEAAYVVEAKHSCSPLDKKRKKTESMSIIVEYKFPYSRIQIVKIYLEV